MFCKNKVTPSSLVQAIAHEKYQGKALFSWAASNEHTSGPPGPSPNLVVTPRDSFPSPSIPYLKKKIPNEENQARMGREIPEKDYFCRNGQSTPCHNGKKKACTMVFRELSI